MTTHVLQTVVPTIGARIAVGSIAMERWNQDEQWGANRHHPAGTADNDETRWMRDWARDECEEAAKDGTLTWRHIAEEEIYEAFAEEDPVKLRAELVQAAAVLAAWIEDIDSRGEYAPEPLLGGNQ
jgi:hypothetical protein